MPEILTTRPTPDALIEDEALASGIREWPAYDIVSSARTISRAHDRLMQMVGTDIYERMMQSGSVAPQVETLQLAISSVGWTVRPAFEASRSAFALPTPEDRARADQAARVAEFVQSVLEQMSTSMTGLLKELTDAIPYGHRLAEIVYSQGTRENVGRLVIDRINVKPPSSYQLIVDRGGRVLGAVSIGSVSGIPTEQQGEGITVDVPRWRLLLVSHNPKAGDPRGTSVLMAAYQAWFGISNVTPDLYKFLRTFGNPFIIGKTAPNREMVAAENPDGTIDQANPRSVSGVRQLLTQLQLMANSGLIASTSGSEVQIVQATGDGAAFRAQIEAWKREIAEVILGTAQATKEAKSESRSSKDVAQDVMGMRVVHGRIVLCEAFTRDVIRPLVEVNFGFDAAEQFCPRLTMATSEAHDLSKLLPAFASALREGLITQAQLPWVWEFLGIDGPDAESYRAELAALAEDAALAAADVSKIYQP